MLKSPPGSVLTSYFQSTLHQITSEIWVVCSDRTWRSVAESCWPSELVSYTEAPLSELALGLGPPLWPQSGLGRGPLVPSSAKISTASHRSSSSSDLHHIAVPCQAQLPNQRQAWPDRHTALTVSRGWSSNTAASCPNLVFYSCMTKSDAHTHAYICVCFSHTFNPKPFDTHSPFIALLPIIELMTLCLVVRCHGELLYSLSFSVSVSENSFYICMYSRRDKGLTLPIFPFSLQKQKYFFILIVF